MFKRVNENYDWSSWERYSGTPRTARTVTNVCHVIHLIFSQKRATIHQTTQLKHLGLCTAACIPEPCGYDVDKTKQRLIEVLAGCMQQTVVDEATGDWRTKKNFLDLWLCKMISVWEFVVMSDVAHSMLIFWHQITKVFLIDIEFHSIIMVCHKKSGCQWKT